MSIWSYVEKKLISEELIRDFHEAMVLREEADYHGAFSPAGAKQTVDTAKIFYNKATEILSTSL